MTQAQKTAKANFKKAIEYRKKTGVSLKEAFAHVYGKKVGAVKKKAAPKKKAVKRGAKTKVLKPIKQRGTSVKSYDKRHQALPSGKRKTAWGTTYYESRANRSDKGVLLGINKPKTLQDLGIGQKKYALENYQSALKGLQFLENRFNNYKIAYKSPLMTKQDKMALKKEIVVLTKMLNSQKKYLVELKKHL